MPASDAVVKFPLPLLYHVSPTDPDVSLSGDGKSVIMLLKGVILTLFPPYKLLTLPMTKSVLEDVTIL